MRLVEAAGWHIAWSVQCSSEKISLASAMHSRCGDIELPTRQLCKLRMLQMLGMSPAVLTPLCGSGFHVLHLPALLLKLPQIMHPSSDSTCVSKGSLVCG